MADNDAQANIFRWAAKEAVIKAHETKLYMHDIIIQQKNPSLEKNNAPWARIILDHEKDISHVAQLSISHDGDYATATCLAFDSGAKDDWIYRWTRMSVDQTSQRAAEDKAQRRHVHNWKTGRLASHARSTRERPKLYKVEGLIAGEMNEEPGKSESAETQNRFGKE